MPKNKKTNKEESIILEDGDTATVPATELDPEILSALESKKKKKIPAPSDVDYIPELERDIDFSDTF